MLLFSGKRCAGSVDAGGVMVTVKRPVAGSMIELNAQLTCALPSVACRRKLPLVTVPAAIGSLKATTMVVSGETLTELSSGLKVTIVGGVASSVTGGTCLIVDTSATVSAVPCAAQTVLSSGP